MTNKKKHYFTEEQQRAVIQYKHSEDTNERNLVFNKYLYKPFQQMVAGILGRYNFHMGKYSFEELEINAMTHLVENFEKFDEWKPDNIEKSIDYKFEVNGDYNGKFVFDKNGKIKNIECENFEDFRSYLNETLVGIETIHKDVTIPVIFKIKTRNKNNKKYLNVTVDKDFQDKNYKHLDLYYKSKLPHSSDEKRFNIYKKLKYKIYSPIFEERLAFSYCQTIIKNYFINHSTKTYQDKLKNLKMQYHDEGDDNNDFKKVEDGFIYYMENSNIRMVYENIIQDCVEAIEDQLDTNEFLDEDIKDVGFALVEILNNWELILNGEDEDNDRNIKSRINKFVIEQTGIPKKIVTKSLKFYFEMMSKTKKNIIENGTYSDELYV